MTVPVPRHARGVRLRPDGDGALLIAAAADAPPSAADLGLALDPIALALWELCDGETTVEEMTLAVCALFDASPESVRPDITSVLDTLDKAGLLDWVPAAVPPP